MEEVKTIRLPVVAKMIQHEDGSFSVDHENSTYADVPVNILLGMILNEMRLERDFKKGPPSGTGALPSPAAEADGGRRNEA